jgi:hypothetical protein
MESASKSLDMDDLERKTSSPDTDILEFTRDEELKLLRKFDFFILPPLAFMCELPAPFPSHSPRLTAAKVLV